MTTQVTTLPDAILEGSTPTISGTLTNKTGVAIPLVDLLTLKLTLYSMSDSSFPIINNRDAQDVLNLNRVTVDANGGVAWNLDSVDSGILSQSLGQETHRAIFAWTYNEGLVEQTGKHIIDFKVKNLQKG